VGIIADTHDNLPLVERAIDKLNQEEVDIILHAGDYVSPFTVTRLKRLKAKLIGVFGNNDGDHEFLKKRFEEIEGAEVRGRFAEINIDGLKVAVLHDDGELFHSLVNSQGYDVVIHGHIHEAQACKKGKTIIINPGEACGYLSGKPTIAIFDTVTRRTRIARL
jgi:putative phosphoesterase